MTTDTIFDCTMCGTCCQGYGGTYLTPEETQRIADYVGVSVDQLLREYCQLSGGRPLLAQSSAGCCVFFKEACTIHPVKPRMCRAWPYLESILVDVGNWHAMASTCPGMRTDLPDETVRRCVAREISKRNAPSDCEPSL